MSETVKEMLNEDEKEQKIDDNAIENREKYKKLRRYTNSSKEYNSFLEKCETLGKKFEEKSLKELRERKKTEALFSKVDLYLQIEEYFSSLIGFL
jgi:uncharacterized membrane protein YgaE (UPF0421/DUF939 family)